MRLAISGLLLFATMGVPALAEEYGELSKRCYENGTPDQIIDACSAVIAAGIAKKEDLGTAFKNRASAYDIKGRYDHAIRDYDHAIAINPNDADALNNRGTSYRAIGQYVLAIKDYDQSLALKPNHPMALGNRCFARAMVGQFELALDDCNRSLRLDPKASETLASRGFTYFKMKRYEEATDDFDTGLRLNPGNAYMLFGRGAAKRMKGSIASGDADIAAAKTLKAGIADEMAKLGMRP